MDNFNPFGSTAPKSVVAALLAQTSDAFRLIDGEVAPLREGDGTTAIGFAVSVGNGKGSSRLALTGDQVAPVTAALRAWDPEEDLTSLPPVECVKRTLSSDGETVTFKVSLAKNSRAIKIPAGEWSDFLDYMDNVGTWTLAAVEHYRNVVRESEEAANK